MRKLTGFDADSMTGQLRQGVHTAARAALGQALDVKTGESVLIIGNPDGDIPLIVEELYNGAVSLGASPVLLYQGARSGVELAERSTIAAIASSPDVIITVTANNLGQDAQGLQGPYIVDGKKYSHVFYYLLASAKSRGAWCPGVTADIFARTIDIDYPLMWKRAGRLGRIFDLARAIHVTTPAGTDLTIDLNERFGMLDDGDYRRAGSGGNLPAGEVFAVPGQATHGTAVIDGSMSLVGETMVPRKPVTIVFEDGHIRSISGDDEARRFRQTMDQLGGLIDEQERQGMLSHEQASVFRQNRLNIAELGIGLNPAAHIIGNMTEDEKVLQTCHIAVGDDCYGYAPSIAHLDLIMFQPSFVAILESGKRISFDPLDPPAIDD